MLSLRALGLGALEFVQSVVICCLWPFGHDPELQLERNGRSSWLCSRGRLEMVARAPHKPEYTTSVCRCWPRPAECSKSIAETVLEPQNARRSQHRGTEFSIVAAPAFLGAKSAARAHIYEVRAFLALDMAVSMCCWLCVCYPKGFAQPCHRVLFF